MPYPFPVPIVLGTGFFGVIVGMYKKVASNTEKFPIIM